jgi:serine/threonine protein kinase
MNPNPEQKASGPMGSFHGELLKSRYRVEKELGRGGFATTYLASDTQLDSRPVVIKVLLEYQAEDPWVLKKFRQEMQALARLDHPGIVGALDSGQLPDGNPFLVMQFIKGQRLRDAMNPKGMDFHRVAGIVRQLSHALSAAHDSGICHRDIKPENIMLQNLGEGEEQAKLIDFGIASIRDSRLSTAADSTKIAGSFDYMAREQFEGKSSPASDVYALGVVAYEMVTGRHPFCSETPAELMRMHMEGVRLKPRDLRPRLSETAQDCILKALSKEPENRYARARDFGESLARALTGEDAHVSSSATARGAENTAATEPFRQEISAQRPLEIAHVLFMDLVGYSILPIDQQTKVLSLLQRVVQESQVFRKAEEKRELMSLPTGDGMALVFFGDPVMPAECALSISRATRIHPELKLRIGLHTGPVYRLADINANSNVAGGGINMAQRVMDCGDAGHILLSGSMAELIGQLSDWAPRLKDLGEHQVKHGTRVHLFNLTAGELGNPSLPEKVRTAQTAAQTLQQKTAHGTRVQPRGVMFAVFGLLIVAGGFILYRTLSRNSTATVRPANSLVQQQAPPKIEPAPPAPVTQPAIGKATAAGSPAVSSQTDRGSEVKKPGLPAPRHALTVEEYGGPLRGELRWSGSLASQDTLTIQAGHVLSGSLNGDLPLVPVTIEVATPGIDIVEAPAAKNGWDRVVLRKTSPDKIDVIIVRWRIAR